MVSSVSDICFVSIILNISLRPLDLGPTRSASASALICLLLQSGMVTAFMLPIRIIGGDIVLVCMYLVLDAIATSFLWCFCNVKVEVGFCCVHWVIVYQ